MENIMGKEGEIALLKRKRMSHLINTIQIKQKKKDKRSRQNCSLLFLMLQIREDTQVKEARQTQNLQKEKLWFLITDMNWNCTSHSLGGCLLCFSKFHYNCNKPPVQLATAGTLLGRELTGYEKGLVRPNKNIQGHILQGASLHRMKVHIAVHWPTTSCLGRGLCLHYPPFLTYLALLQTKITCWMPTEVKTQTWHLHTCLLDSPSPASAPGDGDGHAVVLSSLGPAWDQDVEGK